MNDLHSQNNQKLTTRDQTDKKETNKDEDVSPKSSN